MKKHKLVVDNKLKGSYGETVLQKGKKPIVKINVKAHGKDMAELASTIKHELMHVKHPNMTEKEVYKKTRKSKMPTAEQIKYLDKLKSINQKSGAIKRKLNISRYDKVKPGDLINRAKLTK